MTHFLINRVLAQAVPILLRSFTILLALAHAFNGFGKTFGYWCRQVRLEPGSNTCQPTMQTTAQVKQWRATANTVHVALTKSKRDTQPQAWDVGNVSASPGLGEACKLARVTCARQAGPLSACICTGVFLIKHALTGGNGTCVLAKRTCIIRIIHCTTCRT